jgi:hypothetical protein
MPNENTQPTSFEDLQNQIQLCMMQRQKALGRNDTQKKNLRTAATEILRWDDRAGRIVHTTRDIL